MISIVTYMRRYHTRKFIDPLLLICLREYSVTLSIHTSLLSFPLLHFISFILLFFSRELLFCFVMDKSSNNTTKSKYDADDDDDDDDKKKEKKNWFSRKRAGSLADSEADAQSKLRKLL